jgi:AraC-like DNA-binding protein
MSVVAARPVVEVLERRGIDAERVLGTAHIARGALDWIENRLPRDHVRALWDAAAAAARDPALGLHVAEALPPTELIEYIFSTSPNVADGLQRVMKYIALVDDRADLRLVVEPLAARVVGHGLRSRHYDEYWVALLLFRIAQATRVDVVPARVAFHHHAPADQGEHKRVFRCPLVFGAPSHELAFAPAVLELALESRDSRLLAILERYAAALLERLGGRSAPLVGRVSHAICLHMRRALPSLADVAKALKLPARTLQRQLARDGVTFSALVDDVRRALALQHIGDVGVSITEVAYLLHFSDPTAFYRAFKRWTGQAPLRYRERLLFGRSDASAARSVRRS